MEGRAAHEMVRAGQQSVLDEVSKKVEARAAQEMVRGPQRRAIWLEARELSPEALPAGRARVVGDEVADAARRAALHPLRGNGKLALAPGRFEGPPLPAQDADRADDADCRCDDEEEESGGRVQAWFLRLDGAGSPFRVPQA